MRQQVYSLALVTGLMLGLVYTQQAQAQEEVLNVQRATGINVDGNPSEWNLPELTTYSLAGQNSAGDVALIGYHDGTNYYGALHTASGWFAPTSTQDFRARVWGRHDDAYFYFLVRFDDSDKQIPQDASMNWANDCIEIYIDPDNDNGSAMLNTEDCQLVIDQNGQKNVYMTTTGYRDQVLAGVTCAAADATYESNAGVWLEVRIEKTALNPDFPASAGGFGLNFNFRDVDSGADTSSILDWSGDYSGSGGFPTKQPDAWGDASLSDTALPDLTLEIKRAVSPITIDGDDSDWYLGDYTTAIKGGTSGAGDMAFVGYDSGLVYRGGFCPGSAMPIDAFDHAATIYARHDETDVYFLVRIEDDDIQSTNPVTMNWANDGVEIYIDPSHDAGDAPLSGSETSNLQLVIDAANQPNVWMTTAGYKTQVLAGLESAVTQDLTGWTLEVRLSKSATTPAIPGDGVFGLELNFRDNDNGNDGALTSIYSWRDPYREGTAFSCPTKRPKNFGDGDMELCIGDDGTGDSDSDGYCSDTDNCPEDANSDQSDSDSDGLGDACDSCPNTIPGSPIDANGCPPVIPFDFDTDGDVDGDDYMMFQSCGSGPQVPHTGTPLCLDSDTDSDNDVDQDDFAVFQRCISGQDMPGDPSCAD